MWSGVASRQDAHRYCKDADRRATYANERFDFLGYTFRPRSSKRKAGTYAVNFLPAVSNDAMKAMGQKLRSWRINRRSDKSLDELAHFCNKVVQGWINYYERFYKSGLYPLLRRINTYLVRWAKRKYERLRRHTKRAQHWLVRIARRQPTLFAHWRLARPDAGQWELSESRGSRSVLREPEGATPSGHSPSFKFVRFLQQTRGSSDLAVCYRAAATNFWSPTSKKNVVPFWPVRVRTSPWAADTRTGPALTGVGKMAPPTV